MNGIKPQTIVRTVVLALAIINRVLVSTGHSPLPFESEETAELVADLITIAAALWAWWKNNSFTKNAIEADKVLENLKEGEKGVG